MGIDVSTMLAVSYTDLHQSRIDTSVDANPVSAATARGLIVHSIFRRMVTSAPASGDGNPLMYALKSKDGFHISEDEICKFMPSFHQIVEKIMEGRAGVLFAPVPSSHGVVLRVTEQVVMRSANADVCSGLFAKKSCEEVAVDLEQVAFPQELKKDGVKLLKSLRQSPAKTFSMKEVKSPQLRPFINPLKLARAIPAVDAEIILVDDLMSTGTTFDSAYALLVAAGVAGKVSGISLLSKL